MPPTETEQTKDLITVACCMPMQYYDRKAKLAWLEDAIRNHPCDLFLTPQEYLGGHYVMKDDLHMDRFWLVETVGDIARRHKTCIGIGACVKEPNRGAMEEYLYFSSGGDCLGYHSKFALPSYDDQRTGGHGQLWPETNYKRRTTPIEIPELRLTVGTVFCWEVFSQTIWSAYSFQRCNLIVHPIKFAPRGWLNNKKQADGKLHIVGFGNAPKSQMWVDRLIMAGRHQVFCPIAVSCNSWNLGEKFKALVGHVDEMRHWKDDEGNTHSSTVLLDIPSDGSREEVHTFQMLPEFYTGMDHHHSPGAFKAHVGSVDGFSEMGEWTMHGKIRRLEAQLIGGGTAMDCAMKEAVKSRQKNATIARALGARKQQVRRK